MHLTDTYFRWNPLTHTIDCAAPAWDIDVRRDEGAHPLPHREDLQHACTNGNCGHASTFTRVTVRVICRSCGTAHLISGEDLGQVCTTTEAIGYGQPPRQLAGLYLWPSAPVLYGEGPGRSGYDDQPRSYLATTRLVERLTPEDCVGAIGRHPTARSKELWWARAVPIPLPGRLAAAEPCLNFARRASELPSLDVAAAWIAAAQTQTAPVEVTV